MVSGFLMHHITPFNQSTSKPCGFASSEPGSAAEEDALELVHTSEFRMEAACGLPIYLIVFGQEHPGCDRFALSPQ